MVLLICTAISGGLLRASHVEQSQEEHLLYNDWGTGNGQTFRTTIGGLLTGIEVVIENTTKPGSVEVYLWRTGPTGEPIEPKLATGYLDRTNVLASTSAWYTISFEKPYAQSADECLAFTIVPKSPGIGWNEYGFVNTNAYTNGLRILYAPPWDPGYFSAWTDSDWAFRTLVIPTPRLLCAQTKSTELTLSALTTDPDAEYVLQTCTNGNCESWSNIATNTGNNGSLIWGVPIESHGQSYFRLTFRKK
jgi:hypothetical protein